MMKKITLFFLSLILISGICVSQNTGSIALTKGQKLSVESAFKIAITQELMGQSIEINGNINVSNTLDAKEIKDTSYVLTNTITKLKVNTSAMGQDESYDSEKKEDRDSERGKTLGKILNNPKNVEINKSGKVVNKPKADTTQDEGTDMITGMIENMFGNTNDGSGGINLVFQPIPSNATAGYNWSDSSEKDGTLTHVTYTIKELKGKEALIDVKGNVQVLKKVQAQGMEITNKSSGTLTGDMIVDVTTGIVKQRNTTVDSKGTMEMMGQEIPGTTKITSTVSVKQ